MKSKLTKFIMRLNKLRYMISFSDYPMDIIHLLAKRGVKLSGGQRQRIGIARAIYKGAKVLFFDEATSALDNKTENQVMDAIYSLNKDLTIILIAHRLNTVSKCDQIIEIKGGGIN